MEPTSVLAAGTAIYKGVSSLLGGSSVAPAQKVDPSRLANVLRTAPPAAITELRRAYQVAYGTSMPTGSMTELARLLSGGSDGKFTSQSGKDLSAYYWTLDGQFGSGVSAAVGAGFGTPQASIVPISGGVTYDDGGLSGGIRFGHEPQQRVSWVMIAIGAVLLLAVWAVVTGRGGRTSGGLQ